MRLLQEIQIPIPRGAVSVYLSETAPGCWAVHTIARLSIVTDKRGAVPFVRLANAHAYAWEEARMHAATWAGAGEPRTVYLHTPAQAAIMRGYLAGFVSDAAPAGEVRS
jgi:hypothetical protein